MQDYAKLYRKRRKQNITATDKISRINELLKSELPPMLLLASIILVVRMK